MGLIVGLFSGLFGVGGGILLIPVLVLIFHVAQKSAQATSLVVVAIAATAGAATYTLGQSVAWGSVGFLLLGGLVGTWVGSAVVIKISTRWLQVLFAVLLIIVALRLIFSPEDTALVDPPDLDSLVVAGYVGAGFVMGVLSSLLGIGGGIIVIPLLVTFFGFTQQLAAGTSLVVMVPIALFGALRLTRSGYTQWAQGSRIGLAAACGAVGGANLALVTDPLALQIAFGVVVVLAAGQMLWKAQWGTRPRGDDPA